MSQPRGMQAATGEAPTPTFKVAKCNVCKVSWEVKSPTGADERGCSFCDAPKKAITVVSEAPVKGGAKIT